MVAAGKEQVRQDGLQPPGGKVVGDFPAGFNPRAVKHPGAGEFAVIGAERDARGAPSPAVERWRGARISLYVIKVGEGPSGPFIIEGPFVGQRQMAAVAADERHAQSAGGGGQAHPWP